MYEKLDCCPICNEGTFHNHVIAKDHLVSQESFAIVCCSNCGFKFTNPRPTKNEISNYYQSEEYVSHADKSNTPINLAYKIVRSYTVKSKVSIVKKYSKSRNILDFGCGTGNFLNACARQNILCFGLEPDTKAREIAVQNKKLNVISKLSQVPKDIKFDVITLWHVLEHIHDLSATIKQLRTLLTDKGTLIVAVPNAKSWDAQHYKENWAAYDVPRHLYHFEVDTMLKLMTKQKFKKIKIIPQKWDAFYVSLLSEKYIKNPRKYIEGIINGFKSNKLASKNNMYSSLIYIFSK